jgi:hypothetical protein
MTKPLTPEQKAQNKLEREALKLAKQENQTAIVRGGSSEGSTGRTTKRGNSRRDNGQDSGDTNQSVIEIGGSDGSSGGSDGSSNRTDRGSIGETGRSDRGDSSGSGGSTGSETAGKEKKPVTQNTGRLGAPKIIKPSNKTKSKGSKEKKADLTDSETLTTLITSLSTNYAKISRKPYWVIEQEEAQTIADPASIVLQSIPKKQIEKVNKLLAPISLIIAVGSVLVPRVMMDISLAQQAKRGASQNGQRPITQDQNSAIRGGGINPNIKQPGSSQSETVTRNSETNSVNVSPEIAGLFESSNTGDGSGDITI